MAKTFQQVFDEIADGIKDLSSLEVTTYKGKIELKSVLTAGKKELKFDDILQQIASGNASIRLVASTKSEIDGDITAFLDQDATPTEVAAHTQLVDSANVKRSALIQVVTSIVHSAAGK
jgi:triacylglycerol esterase/lipase EstA (alpha/beta hydrolase family)